jgi:hypothetical protein
MKEGRFVVEENKDFTYYSENGVAWVNGKHNCLGRFSSMGWEIYPQMNAPTEVVGTTQTLAVRKHDTKPIDWGNFKKLMKEFHKIDISDKEYPGEK